MKDFRIVTRFADVAQQSAANKAKQLYRKATRRTPEEVWKVKMVNPVLCVHTGKPVQFVATLERV